MKPITSPDGYRLWWTVWTVGVAIVLVAVFYLLGPIVIARGIELARRSQK